MTQQATRFATMGNRIFVAPPEYPTMPEIPVGTYSMGFDPENIPGGFFIKPIDDFTLPEKIYGHNTEYADVILSTFQEREGSITTAALSGQKGSGKTLTAKEISILGAQLGIPTIEVSLPFAGPSFNQFIQSIRQPAIIFIDEFEKVYKDEDDRNRLLGLLDGPYKTHKLFLLTMNKTLNNSNFEYFFNRPGRVYFNIPYGAVTDEIVKEYCEDHLVDLKRLPDVSSFARRFTYFTLDMLTVLVKEINKTGKTCQEISHIINIKPDLEVSQIMFEVTVLDKDGKIVPQVFSEYGLNEKPNSVAVPYNFARDALSRVGRITFAVSTKEQFADLFSAYQASQNSSMSWDENFDEEYDEKRLDREDPEAVKRFNDRVAHYEKFPRAFVSYNLGVRQENCEHSQDPETRAVTITHPDCPYTILIEPAGKKEVQLAYSF
jgi:hypothetical protein